MLRVLKRLSLFLLAVDCCLLTGFLREGEGREHLSQMRYDIGAYAPMLFFFLSETIYI